MTTAADILNLSKRINALAEIGLTYAGNQYETERYEELRSIGRQMMSRVSGQPIETLEALFRNEREYKTPQVDIRAVVFDSRDRLLMVREKADGMWSLPGGWADVGFSPSEIAAKEVREETGLTVQPERLIAVFDKKCHPHPPHLHYVYKIFIGCGLLGGELQTAFDTLDAGFFAKDRIPALSEERVTPAQIRLMFEYRRDPNKPAMFD
jgi:ADP-ribose pyrophosphatase YjhB (NUDIX family)